MAHEVDLQEMLGIREIPDEFVQCRTLLHAWDEIPDDGGGGGLRAFAESRSTRRLLFRCVRCGMKRYEAWSAITGDLLFRHYTAPEQYKMLRDESKRKNMRVEYVRRLGTYQKPPTRKAASNGKAKKKVTVSVRAPKG